MCLPPCVARLIGSKAEAIVKCDLQWRGQRSSTFNPSVLQYITHLVKNCNLLPCRSKGEDSETAVCASLSSQFSADLFCTLYNGNEAWFPCSYILAAGVTRTYTYTYFLECYMLMLLCFDGIQCQMSVSASYFLICV